MDFHTVRLLGYEDEARFHIHDLDFCKAMVDGLDLGGASPKKVLEIGPGLGHLGAYIVRSYPNVEYHAADCNPEFLRRTKRRVTATAANPTRSDRMTFTKLDILHRESRDLAGLSLTHGRFDIVIAQRVMQEFLGLTQESVARSVAEHLLALGGAFVYTTQPYAHNPSNHAEKTMVTAGFRVHLHPKTGQAGAARDLSGGAAIRICQAEEESFVKDFAREQVRIATAAREGAYDAASSKFALWPVMTGWDDERRAVKDQTMVFWKGYGRTDAAWAAMTSEGRVNFFGGTATAFKQKLEREAGTHFDVERVSLDAIVTLRLP